MGKLELIDFLEIHYEVSVFINDDLNRYEDTNVVREYWGSGHGGLYELAEHLTGHHHHLVCSACGAVRDVVVPDALERDLDVALAKLAKREGFALDHHRLDLVGRCASCR